MATLQSGLGLQLHANLQNQPIHTHIYIHVYTPIWNIHIYICIFIYIYITHTRLYPYSLSSTPPTLNAMLHASTTFPSRLSSRASRYSAQHLRPSFTHNWERSTAAPEGGIIWLSWSLDFMVSEKLEVLLWSTGVVHRFLWDLKLGWGWCLCAEGKWCGEWVWVEVKVKVAFWHACVCVCVLHQIRFVWRVDSINLSISFDSSSYLEVWFLLLYPFLS